MNSITIKLDNERTLSCFKHDCSIKNKYIITISGNNEFLEHYIGYGYDWKQLINLNSEHVHDTMKVLLLNKASEQWINKYEKKES
jgi:hypothetical protein